MSHTGNIFSCLTAGTKLISKWRRLQREESGIVVYRQEWVWMPAVICVCVLPSYPKEEYQDTPLLGDEELWGPLRTSYVTSLGMYHSTTWYGTHFLVYHSSCGSCTQGHHDACHPTSTCHTSSYSASKVKLTEPLAAQTLLSTLKGTNIYKMAPAFCRVGVKKKVLNLGTTWLLRIYSAVTLTGWRASITNCSPTSRSGFTSPWPLLGWGWTWPCSTGYSGQSYAEIKQHVHCSMYRMIMWIVPARVNATSKTFVVLTAPLLSAVPPTHQICVQCFCIDLSVYFESISVSAVNTTPACYFMKKNTIQIDLENKYTQYMIVCMQKYNINAV